MKEQASNKLKELNKLFGSYRAEWLRGEIFELFAEPSYFTALKGIRPCVLEGGRGTGKTTVLRGLSYQGQYALKNQKIDKLLEESFIGIYHRVNTNHVRAFEGEEYSTQKWKKLFGHYINLVVCKKISDFLVWLDENHSYPTTLNEKNCKKVAKSLNINSDNIKNITNLNERIDDSLLSFQSLINDQDSNDKHILSTAGIPIEVFTEAVCSLDQLKDKVFYIILDEFENFTDYQQVILNTLIKHNTEYFTFKIGVRELGWRIKHTSNKSELLYDPADYVLINIRKKLEESHFANFAKTVCEQRINRIIDSKTGYSIDKALESLTVEEEAEKLDVVKNEIYKEFEKVDNSLKIHIEEKSKLFKYFLAYWSRVHGVSVQSSIDSYIKQPKEWNTRYDNYKFEMLFKIRKGRGKRGIQKYYCGWSTYVKIANGNIRYLMELVYKAYEKHIEKGYNLKESISCKTQTLAAQEVGEKNLMELEGLWKNGAQLTKLLFGLGRVLQVLSSSEGKASPEKNQFAIDRTLKNYESVRRCNEILDAAVMNLALIRVQGNKPTDESQTKEYLFTIHPIYSPFFIFSYRRKRKFSISDTDILGLIDDHRTSVKGILKKLDVNDFDSNLPFQMKIFEPR